MTTPILNHFSGCNLNSADLSDLWGIIISNMSSGSDVWIRTKVGDTEVIAKDIPSLLQHPELRHEDMLNFLDIGVKISDRSIRIQVDNIAGVVTSVQSSDSFWSSAISTKLARFFSRHQPSSEKVSFLKQLKRREFVSCIIGLALAFVIRYAVTQQSVIGQVVTVITSVSWVYLGISYYEWSKTPVVSGAKIVLKPPKQDLVQRRGLEILAIVIAFLSLIFTIAQVVIAVM